ncbi:MAG: alpha/beta hydrolase [Edaphobacter sp.]
MFVHDWGCTSRIWKDVVMHLGAFLCITYDQRGWGRTQPANGSSYTLDIFSGDVSALVRQLNGKEFVLVAHGIGGRVALRFAERKPVGLAGMVLIACSPAWTSDSDSHKSEERYALLLEEPTLPDWLRLATRMKLGWQTRQKLLEDARSGSDTAKRSWRALEADDDLKPSLNSITCPVIVVGAELDSFYDIDSQRLLACAIPNASFQLFEGCGHLLPVEQSSRLAEVIARFASTHTRLDVSGATYRM